MNNLQKNILAAITIFSFGSYAYFVRPQSAVIAAADTTSMKQSPDGAPIADAGQNPSLQHVISRLISEKEAEFEREEDDEDGPRRVVARPAPQPVQTSAPAQSAPVQTSPQATAPQSGQYRDGTYTGSSVDVFYGFVQVQAVIKGGKLASINFLRYPNDRDTSRQINDQAMPILNTEAIQAQSANVSGVSGATDTSIGFTQSLGEALAQAHV